MKTAFLVPVLAAALAACSHGRHSLPEVVFAPRPHPLPMPAAELQTLDQMDNPSLWTTAPNSLLSMRRAKAVGDLLTVVVEVNDQASLQSSLSRSRTTSEDLNVDALLGLPEWAGSVLPGGASLSPGVDYDRQSDLDGSGAVNRAESITFKLAARVIGLESNGNLIIQGYQQTQVSNEVRYLTVSGVVRAQDITRTNTVTYDKIADANLAYVNAGGALAPVRQGAATKVLQNILPF